MHKFLFASNNKLESLLFDHFVQNFVVLSCREAPQLAALLSEMKEGLDTVRRKVQSLTANVSGPFFNSSNFF